MEKDNGEFKMKKHRESTTDITGRRTFERDDIIAYDSGNVVYGVIKHLKPLFFNGREYNEWYKIRRFVKEPQPTDIVRVYHGAEGRIGYDYGRVVRVIVGEDEEEKEINGVAGLREIVELHKINGEYGLGEIDFFLLDTKVNFIKK